MTNFFKARFIVFFLSICPLGAVAQPRTDRSPKDLFALISNTNPDTNRVKLFIELGFHYLVKPGTYKTNMDSAFTQFNKAMKLSELLHSEKWNNESLRVRGQAYLKQRDLVRGRADFMMVINREIQAGRLKDEARTWMRLGLALQSNDTASYKVRREALQTAYTRLKKLNDIFNQLETLRAIADADLNLRRLSLAETEYLQIVSQSKSLHYKHLFYIYSSLGDLNKLRGDLRTVLYYRIEAVKTLEDPTDIYRQKLAYYKLGQIYFELNQFDKSLAFYQKALAYKKSAVNVDYRLYMAYTRTLIALNRSGEALEFLKLKAKSLSPTLLPENRMIIKSLALCYTALGQFNQAEKCHLQTLSIDDQIFKAEMYLDVQNYVADYNDICDFLIKFKQYKKAEAFMGKFFRLNQSMVNPIALSHAYLVKFKIDSASGNYFSAINNLQRHNLLNDSLFNDTKSNQISELQIRYETAQKEKSIMTLQSQGQKQHVALQKLNLERNLVLCSVLVLLVITGLVYNGFRRNKKNSLKLQRQQTEINMQNISLHELNNKQQLLLNEKEWLIREIHHRVKNNLQTTMSLLNMQTAYLSNIDAIDAINSSQRRMHAMALVHQELYHSANLASINMKVYIRELVNYLGESFERSGEIKFDLLTEAIQLDLAMAIPIGLIINEAVTNCIMYAFPDSKSGTITIKFTIGVNDDFILSVSDNGIGLPKSINHETTRSLGLNLIKGLTDQIQGSLEIQGLHGMQITITFKNIK